MARSRPLEWSPAPEGARGRDEGPDLPAGAGPLPKGGCPGARRCFNPFAREVPPWTRAPRALSSTGAFPSPTRGPTLFLD